VYQSDWTFTENGLYTLKNGVFHDKTVNFWKNFFLFLNDSS